MIGHGWPLPLSISLCLTWSHSSLALLHQQANCSTYAQVCDINELSQLIESEGEDRVKKKLGRKTPSAAGRKGKSVLPLFKGKCAPVPIVSWLTGSYGRWEGCHPGDSPAPRGVGEKQKYRSRGWKGIGNIQSEWECLCVCTSSDSKWFREEQWWQ